MGIRGIAAAAQALAGSGYIVTAIGRVEFGADSFAVVGTRVVGSDDARPFTSDDGSDLDDQLASGFAIVGVLPTAPLTYLYEK